MGSVMPNDAPFNARIRQAAREIAGERESSAQTLAMAHLYDLTADRLVRFAASITRRQHDAEDAVSTTMVKVATRPKLLVGADQPWHYLLRMVRNESLVILRSRSRWSAIGSIAERLIGRSSDVVERDDENRLGWKAMESLPATQSEVVVLTFAEIAEVLQITPSTAASRYRYALEKLAGKLSRVSNSQPADVAQSSDSVVELGR